MFIALDAWVRSVQGALATWSSLRFHIRGTAGSYLLHPGHITNVGALNRTY